MATDNTKGQYSLFDEPKGNVTVRLADGEKRVYLQNFTYEQFLQYRQEQGVYIPVGDADLWKRAQEHYKLHAERTEALLRSSDLDSDTIDVVMNDYGNALLGSLSFYASAYTMSVVLQKILPYEAFLLDKYGFYFLLMHEYNKCRHAANEYKATVRKTPNGVPNLRSVNYASVMQFGAFVWAIRNEYIKIEFLEEAREDYTDLQFFLKTMNDWAELHYYSAFYHLAKYAYKATPEQLAAIARPQILGAEDYETVTREYCEVCELALDDVTQNYIETLNPNTPPQEREQATEQAQEWKPSEPKKTLNISRKFNNIGQRPIEASRTPQGLKNTLPIKKHIDAFLMNPQNGKYNNGLLTEGLVQQAILGLDVLRNYKRPTPTKILNNLYYIYQTNMTEFAKYCNIGNANQKEKDALLGCLMLLKGVYVLVSTPYKTLKNEKTGKFYTVGGDELVQVANVPRIGYNNNVVGNVTIQIAADILKGRITITEGTYNKIMKLAKGQNERQFVNQLIGKFNKNENDLIDEVFGYKLKLKDAEAELADAMEAQDEATIEAAQKKLASVKAYIRKNKPAARKKTQEWFEKYLQNGILSTYTRKPNRKGEFVDSWKLADETGVMIIDTDAEMIQDEQPTGEQ